MLSSLKPSLWLFLFCLLTMPFYVFKSGGVQIFHLFLFASIALNPSVLVPIPKLYVLWIFSLFAISIGAFWSASLASLEPLLLSGVFLVSTLFVSCFLKFYSLLGLKFLSVCLKVVAFSLLIQLFAYFALVYVVGAELPVRYRGFFNNPNQMGYFSLLMLVCAVCFFYILDRHRAWFISAVISGTFLALVSLSKAAMLGVFFVLISLFFYRASIVRVAFSFLFFSLLLLLPLDLWDQVSEISNVVDRLGTIGQQSDDSLDGRGYGRIYEFSHLVFFGAGEGGLARFDTHDEIHSTLGSVLFSYGLIPFTFLILVGLQSFLFACLQNKLLFVWVAGVLAIMAYGLTHAGFRSPLFWLVMMLPAIVFTSSELGKRDG